MNKQEFIEELRNLVYSAWVAGEPWSEFGLSWDTDELHMLVGDRVYVIRVDEYSYDDLVKAYGKKETGAEAPVPETENIETVTS
jgi:hypothetical protein